ncbi:MAG: PIG-L family deacetylase [Chloroflexi bacterium]|nr:PIG-L family deacetylase [Chloroflexota bacterium]
MIDERLTLMAVLAHPDDEVWMAGTMARYADRGVRTVLVTATLGEEGEIRDPDLDPEETRERLGHIREAELRRSVEIIGIAQLYILGYRDSGMAGTPANEDPRNFHNADPQDVLRRLVPIIRRERPQVIVTDNERGSYGHPDHLAAHRATLAAFEAAADPGYLPEDGLEAWQTQKLYYSAFARSDFIRMREALRERGISWGDGEDSEEWLDFTVPDELVTTRVDVLPYRSRVRDAMAAHRTQISPDDPWFSLPEDLATELMRDDTFTRARSLVEAPVPEDDLFAGIAAGARPVTSP